MDLQEVSLIIYYLFFTRPGAPPEVAPPIVTEEEDRGPGGVWYYENLAKEAETTNDKMLLKVSLPSYTRESKEQ